LVVNGSREGLQTDAVKKGLWPAPISSGRPAGTARPKLESHIMPEQPRELPQPIPNQLSDREPQNTKMPDGEWKLFTSGIEVAAAQNRYNMAAQDVLRVIKAYEFGPRTDANGRPIVITFADEQPFVPPAPPTTTDDVVTSSGHRGTSPPAQLSPLIQFRPGAFLVRGREWHPLTGKPWQVLRAISESPDLTRTSAWLFAEFWNNSPSSTEVVKDAVSDARSALRRALQVNKDFDPLPIVERGKNRAWRLELRTR
jgi:hypothetical protein